MLTDANPEEAVERDEDDLDAGRAQGTTTTGVPTGDHSQRNCASDRR